MKCTKIPLFIEYLGDYQQCLIDDRIPDRGECLDYVNNPEDPLDICGYVIHLCTYSSK